MEQIQPEEITTIQLSEGDADALNILSSGPLRCITYIRMATVGEMKAGRLRGWIRETLEGASPQLVDNHINALVAGELSERVDTDDAVRVKAVNLRHAVPVASTLLNWSLSTGLSPRILGKSSNSEGRARTPVATLQLFSGLLQSNSLGDFTVPEYELKAGENIGSRHRISVKNERAKFLARKGVLERTDTEREFEILDPVYSGYKTILPITRIAYDVLEMAYQQGGTEAKWTTSKLIELAIQEEKLSPSDEEGIKQLTAVFHRASSASSRAFTGVLEKGERTRILFDIAPEYMRPIEDLVGAFESLNDEEERTRASLSVARIALNARKVQRLYQIEQSGFQD